MKAAIEMFACVDHNGDYGIGRDEATARENYASEIGDLSELDGGYRIVKVKVNVPLPTVMECEVEVEDDEEAGVLAVA